jgi:transcriptional regulator of acetoin/glycerol metabolism
MCDCKYCKRSQEIDAIIASRDVDELVKLIRETQEYEANIALDLEVCEAVLDGSWPGAVEQLERALVKAKEKQVG